MWCIVEGKRLILPIEYLSLANEQFSAREKHVGLFSWLWKSFADQELMVRKAFRGGQQALCTAYCTLSSSQMNSDIMHSTVH